MDSDFDWSQYLVVAKNSMETNLEAFLRTSISRSYFGALNSAYKPVKANIQFKGVSDYQDKIISHYQNDGGSLKKQSIGVNLRRLRVARLQADYQPVSRKSFMKQHADICHSMAKLVIEDLKSS